MPAKVCVVTVSPAMCKQCGVCVAFCPKAVLVADKDGTAKVEHPEECNGCRICELLCPDLAINVDVSE